MKREKEPTMRHQKGLIVPEKRKLRLKEKSQESYLNYEFITAGDSHATHPSKLLTTNIETKH